MADDHVTLTARRHAHLLACEQALRELHTQASAPFDLRCECGRRHDVERVPRAELLDAYILINRPESSR